MTGVRGDVMETVKKTADPEDARDLRRLEEIDHLRGLHLATWAEEAEAYDVCRRLALRDLRRRLP